MPFSYITLLIRSAASREAQKEVETKIESLFLNSILCYSYFYLNTILNGCY